MPAGWLAFKSKKLLSSIFNRFTKWKRGFTLKNVSVPLDVGLCCHSKLSPFFLKLSAAHFIELAIRVVLDLTWMHLAVVASNRYILPRGCNNSNNQPYHLYHDVSAKQVEVRDETMMNDHLTPEQQRCPLLDSLSINLRPG